jgi:hypothetical protein
VHLSGFAGFLRHLGDFVGRWGKITGFLRFSRLAANAGANRRAGVVPNKGASRWRIAAYIALVAAFFGFIFYLRYAGITGSPQTYLYLEIGGTLISFCYAANALVRFRGTHDRIALILAFGFVLSGIIETVGYFALNAHMQAGHAAPTTVPMGWMVSGNRAGRLRARCWWFCWLRTSPARRSLRLRLHRFLMRHGFCRVRGTCSQECYSWPQRSASGSAWTGTSAARTLRACMNIRCSALRL